MRFGIFGGTFDPPHKGHIAIAERATMELQLDRIYFVPAFIPPHKIMGSSASAKHRLNMVKLSIKGRRGFKVSDIELRRQGISYTIDTLTSFSNKFPKAELFLIIGADNLIQFNCWKSPQKILKMATLAVYKRNKYLHQFDDKSINYVILKGKLHLISSTEVRNRIKNHLSIKLYVADSVHKYIKQHSLYSIKQIS